MDAWVELRKRKGVQKKQCSEKLEVREESGNRGQGVKTLDKDRSTVLNVTAGGNYPHKMYPVTSMLAKLRMKQCQRT